jgi:hypothetical protein
VGGMLENFSLCAGYDLNTDNPACLTFEWDQIGADTAKFAPLLLASIEATDRASAAQVIHTDQALVKISAASIHNITCSTCFDAYTTDIWSGWNFNSTMRATCTKDPFNDECYFDPYMSQARNRFVACAGHSIEPETYDRCTASEVKDLGTSSAMIFKNALAITTTSDTLVDNVLSLVTQYASPACSYCYIYFARQSFKLSTTVKAQCLSFNKCAFKQPDFDRIRQGFKTCSGFDIAVDDELSQITSSTQAPFSVTTYVGINVAGGSRTRSVSSSYAIFPFFVMLMYLN